MQIIFKRFKSWIIMKILITGSSGLLGSSIIGQLEKRGHQFIRLVRSQSDDSAAKIWNAETGDIDKPIEDDISTVIHLCGRNLISPRWSKKVKQELRDSRIISTVSLVNLIKNLPKTPNLVITASGIGYYGNQNEKSLSEKEPNGKGFLSTLCRDWEDAASELAHRGIRVVHLRLGIVLSDQGGALSIMKPAFNLGIGGILGDGKQYMSWITIDDVIDCIEFIISDKSLSGPINIVSPNPVTNSEFTKTLGDVLNRPTLIPLPKTVLRILLGEIADELLLASTRVIPEKLNNAKFEFKYSELKDALNHLIKQI